METRIRSSFCAVFEQFSTMYAQRFRWVIADGPRTGGVGPDGVRRGRC